MKTTNFLCATMVCCALAVQFSACSKDEDGPNGAPVKMRLVEINISGSEQYNHGGYYGSYSFSDIYSNFVYDSHGKLLSYEYEHEHESNYDNQYHYKSKSNVTYTYNSSSIEKLEENDEGIRKTIYHLTNGLVTLETFEGSKYSEHFLYENGNLVGWDGDGCYDSYSWENGNPIIEPFDSPNNTKYGYTDMPCYIGNYVDLMDGTFYLPCEPFLMQQGYYGNLPKNLVNSFKGEYVHCYLSYEINANGYPTKITANESDGTQVMTLTWQ